MRRILILAVVFGCESCARLSAADDLTPIPQRVSAVEKKLDAVLARLAAVEQKIGLTPIPQKAAAPVVKVGVRLTTTSGAVIEQQADGTYRYVSEPQTVTGWPFYSPTAVDHTHTCRGCGTTWDHSQDGGSHRCPRCGRPEYVQDPPGARGGFAPAAFRPPFSPTPPMGGFGNFGGFGGGYTFGGGGCGPGGCGLPGG